MTQMNAYDVLFVHFVGTKAENAMSLETNVFRILNTDALSATYKLYRIKGLNNAPDEYYKNRQNIISKLSFSLKVPVTIIDPDGVPHLVVRSDAKPPADLSLVKTVVKFELSSGELVLDFSRRAGDNDRICTRFLDFWIQGILFKSTDLWQPSAGQPFFRKTSEPLEEGLVRYTGYSVRSVITPNNELGFCVDVTSKTVGLTPLPAHLTHDEFTQWKNQTFIYHFGHTWYEFKAIDLSDQNVSEYIIPNTESSLLEYTNRQCRKPIPAELAEVPHDASVVLYLDSRNANRSAIAPLCFPVYRTSNDDAGQQHGHTILEPYLRRRLIHNFVRDNLRTLRMGSSTIAIERHPTSIEPRMFTVPDVRFGNGKVLSARSTPNAQHTSLDMLGKTRLSLLKDKGAGFYTRDQLDRQYFILPQSVYDSYGTRLLDDLKDVMKDLYPQEYNPVVVTYNDRVAKTFAKQGHAIREAVDANCVNPGYAVVMIHHVSDRKDGAEDQLAAMVIHELYDRTPQINAAVMHTSVGSECYFQPHGKTGYEPREAKRKKLLGYLRMVAINKILLTNQRWPFVLDTPLNADLTIGLDVKQHTAGLVVVGKSGGDIQTLLKKSNGKEKLSERQMNAYLLQLIREAAGNRIEQIKTIMLQRDGRVYDTEIIGAHKAVEQLKNEHVIAPDASLTIIEISKSAPVRFRLFDVSPRGNGDLTINPQVGNYCLLGNNEGYVCTTGRAFTHKGTVRPLHIRHIEGPLALEECLEDVFYLSCLTWTRPEDCSRYPITLKLNDRFLSEEATEYDENALELEAILMEDDATDPSYV